ncbi:MAG TPA: nickel pincer cofactor biosynthesis protein LarC [Thermoanaerobaculia bacterium]|nr:nickel pincer cofactor biosynthesis protein LarC [Thermoanaerobaculia bacterium]
MATYHLDCSSGIAGDMFLGACLDLGMPLEVLVDVVARLGLPGVSVESRKAARGGFVGTRFRVLANGRPLEGPDPEEQRSGDHHHHHPHDHSHPHPHDHSHSHPHDHSHDHSHDHGHTRGLAEILEMIGRSALSNPVKERAARLFQRLGEAEAKAHGMPLEHVHFHEVGAIDSIVDLVGAAAAVEHLAPERITCGPVNVGSGRVKMAHGEVPIPAPATAELLKGIPIFGGPGGELTTPTGAVLLAELVSEYVELPAMVLEGTGYGLGKKDLPHQANALRLLRGRAAGTGAEVAEVMIVETEIDDLPGEGFGFLMERLLAAGALDVYFTPVQMKKNRPGTLVTLLCRRPQLAELSGLLLSESGSLGCRYHAAARLEAEREILEVQTAFGSVRVKRARLDGRPLAAAPEFEDCRRLALASGVPWRDVYRAALAAVGAPG